MASKPAAKLEACHDSSSGNSGNNNGAIVMWSRWTPQHGELSLSQVNYDKLMDSGENEE